LVDQCFAVLNSLAKNNPHKELFFITQTIRLMENREIIVVYSENHFREHKYTAWAKHRVFLKLKKFVLNI
jgi:hypothetical protein